MPFVLITIGLLMVVTGVQNTYAQMASQVRQDGTDFLKWGVAIFLIGMMGYVKELQPLSRAMLALILISMILTNSKTGRGLLGNLQDAIDKGPATITPASATGGSAAAPANTLTSQTSGLFGQTPDNAAQAKFNGWMNYFFSSVQTPNGAKP